uniref:hypothetical protein n=1 Tax=Staphylococcus hominis TaxID=1290 RepID=UPI001C930D5D
LVIKVFGDIGGMSEVGEVVLVVGSGGFEEGMEIVIENRWMVVEGVMKGGGKVVGGWLRRELLVDLELGKGFIEFEKDEWCCFEF